MSHDKFWFLQGRCKLSVRQCSEIDYLDQLNEEEKEWLQNFSIGYHTANHKKYEKVLGRTLNDAEKKELNLINNARHRDICARFPNMTDVLTIDCIDNEYQSSTLSMEELIDLERLKDG